MIRKLIGINVKARSSKLCDDNMFPIILLEIIAIIENDLLKKIRCVVVDFSVGTYFYDGKRNL